MQRILILYYSRSGSTAELARQVARGVAQVAGAEPVLRTVPALPAYEKLLTSTTASEPITAADDSAAILEPEELRDCDALIIGSPTRFGNMAAPLKHALDQTGSLWMSGSLSGKPAACFTSTGSQHGGHETTLLTMALPLLHHGMIYIGLPYSHAALHHSSDGGSPYGAGHINRSDSKTSTLADTEIALAQALGRRVARVAQCVNNENIDD